MTQEAFYPFARDRGSGGSAERTDDATVEQEVRSAKQVHSRDTGFGEVRQAFYAKFHTKLQAFFFQPFPALPQASRAGAVEIEAGQGGIFHCLCTWSPKQMQGISSPG